MPRIYDFDKRRISEDDYNAFISKSSVENFFSDCCMDYNYDVCFVDGTELTVFCIETKDKKKYHYAFSGQDFVNISDCGYEYFDEDNILVDYIYLQDICGKSLTTVWGREGV